jgi:hypothetical protein
MGALTNDNRFSGRELKVNREAGRLAYALLSNGRKSHDYKAVLEDE